MTSAHLYRISDLSITLANTWQDVPLNAADQLDGFTHPSDTELRFSVAGKYAIKAHVIFDHNLAAPGTIAQIRLLLNNTEVPFSLSQTNVCETEIVAASGDLLKLQVASQDTASVVSCTDITGVSANTVCAAVHAYLIVSLTTSSSLAEIQRSAALAPNEVWALKATDPKQVQILLPNSVVDSDIYSFNDFELDLVSDTSGNGNDLTNVTAVIQSADVTSLQGGAVASLPGGHYLERNTNLQNELSLLFSFRLSGLSGAQGLLRIAESTSGDFLALRVVANQLQLIGYTSAGFNGSAVIDLFGPLTTDWQTIFVSYSRTGMLRIYLNGAMLLNLEAGDIIGNENLNIAYGYDGTTQMTGDIDYIKVYDKALALSNTLMDQIFGTISDWKVADLPVRITSTGVEVLNNTSVSLDDVKIQVQL